MEDSPHRLRKLKNRLSLGPLSVGHGAVVGQISPDVVFLVENRRLKAHVKVLTQLSPVFESMFSRSFNQERKIELRNIEYSSFKLFLKLVYDGTRSVAVDMTPKETLECILIANKYLVENLESFLKTKLLRHVSYHSVFQVLPYCTTELNIISIQSKCWSVIEGKTSQAIKSSYFKGISWNLFCDVLENTRLTISEFELFMEAKRWAEHFKKVTGTPRSIKEILGVAIYKIRFPLMTQGEWRIVSASGVLSAGEIADLNANFRKNKTFPNQPRKNICACRKDARPCRLCNTPPPPSIKGIVARSCRSQTPNTIPQSSTSNESITKDDEESTDRTFVIRVELINDNAEPEGNAKCCGSRNVRRHSHTTEVTPNAEISCECMKYKSCPAFPNGKTADILVKLGYKYL